MKIQSFILIILAIALILILSGCSFIDLTYVSYKMSAITAIDSTVTVKSEYKNKTESVNMNIIANITDNKAHIKIDDSKSDVYLCDDKIYTVEKGLITDIQDVSEVDTSDEAKLIETINISKIKHAFKFNKEGLENEQTSYTLNIKDEKDVNKIIDLKSFGLSDLNLNFTSCNITIIVDNGSKLPKSMEMAFNTSQEYIITIYVKYNKYNDEVLLILPECVENYINDYNDDSIIEEEMKEFDFTTNNDVKNHNIIVSKALDYIDTTDGIIDYVNLNYDKLIYNSYKNYIIISKLKSVRIYNAETYVLIKNLDFNNYVKCIDTDNEKLAIGFTDNNEIQIIDLDNYELISVLTLNNPLRDFVLDENIIIYTSYNNVIFHNILSNNIIGGTSAYNSHIALNRADHILYICETGLTSTDLIYLNSQTGSVIFKSKSHIYSNNAPIKYNGAYLLYYGRTFDAYSGEQLSSSGLADHYNKLTEFNPRLTIFQDDDYVFISDKSYNLAIYSKSLNSYIYLFEYYPDNVYKLNNNKYLITDKNNVYISVIEVSQITEVLPELPIIQDVVSTYANGDKSIRLDPYTTVSSNNKYIYYLNSVDHTLHIYNKDTLLRIKSHYYLLKPTCIDADNGKLCIGFGETGKIFYYDNPLEEPEIIQRSEPVYSVLLYNNSIIHAPIDQFCDVYMYNLSTKITETLITKAYYVSMAINREDGILYLCDRKISSSDLIYYDLVAKEIIFDSEFGLYQYNNAPVVFDGNFVHFFGYTYNKLTAENISLNSCSRAYTVTGYNNLSTIYDDGLISVFNAYLNGKRVTVFYDIATNSIIKTYDISSYKIIKQDAGYIICLTSYEDILVITNESLNK